MLLIKIKSDAFAETHKEITFHEGLNTVLGSSDGTSAIGKSTFLWIIDYAFGGEFYTRLAKAAKQYVGEHSVQFTFEEDGQPHYFYRTTEDDKHVYRCDADGPLIEKRSLDNYREFLSSGFGIESLPLSFSDMTERFFRIYGRENTSERYPLQIKPREQEDKAIDFLLKLFGDIKILNSIRSLEDQLGIKAADLQSRKPQPSNFEKIEANQITIESLQKRLKELMDTNEDAQLSMFGFTASSFEELQRVRRELGALVQRRNALQSRLDAIENNISISSPEIESEFSSLLHFFPQANIKAFTDIERFHERLRAILHEETSTEIERLRPLISRCDREISRLKVRIQETGVAKEMSERTLSQCVSISKTIDKLEAETQELVRQRELQESKNVASNRLAKVLREQSDAIVTIQDALNNEIAIINSFVTNDTEVAPELRLSDAKNSIQYTTPGNISEGTAFKSLVIYDLAMLSISRVPALIHDFNILNPIEDTYLERILEKYQSSHRQIFIAFEKAGSRTQKSNEILHNSRVLSLSSDDTLFGISWSKKKTDEKPNETEEAEDGSDT
jgi:phage host-nuclease inhibitor protein Gam